MNNQNSYISTNKEWWEKMVKDDCGFTRPWLDLDPDIIQKLSKGQLKNVPKPLNDIFPVSVLADVKDKVVLCLASGGGQQSAVFGLLGAKVTVVDIADGQLDGDKKAADHYGYKVTTIQGDMCDLSSLKDKSFDLVYQGPSISYIPNVKQVYSEVARILKAGGLYRADAQNPVSWAVDEESWDGKGYRISLPYKVKEVIKVKGEGASELRHYLDETFNGLIDCGFTIEYVQEMPHDLYFDGEPELDSWLHSMLYVHGGFAILARKK